MLSLSYYKTNIDVKETQDHMKLLKKKHSVLFYTGLHSSSLSYESLTKQMFLPSFLLHP